MRLLQCDDTGRFTLTPDLASDHVPPYAILSHTWGPDEVAFTDITGTQSDWQQKSGFDKIKFCAEQARRDGLQYFWVDTCCIDKSDSIELQTAINSMFRWYRDAKQCYVYLADVSVPSVSGTEQSRIPWEAAFRTSRWHTRGWTLQELLAPEKVDFYSKEWTRLGDKRSLEQEIHNITKIPITALRKAVPFDQFNIDERMKWAGSRHTTHEEDLAYCLLGIFGVFMPLNYGEGRDNAFLRLNREIGNNPKRQEWLQKLYVCPYQERKNRNPPRVEKTCKWFTNHSLFTKWQMSSAAELLWVSADPGCGKSVLARNLIDDVLAGTILRTTCYFFFKEDYEDQRSSAAAICSLLHQIFHQHPIAFSTQVLEKFEDKGSALLQSFNDLWDIFISATSGHQREFVFILDALDECESSGQIQLINAISEFSSHATMGSPALKFLLLSRPYVDIARRFQHVNHDLATIHLAGENEEEATQISHEIDMVIKSRVEDLSRTLGLDQEKQAILVEELVRVPNRTYLWTQLIFDEIQSSILLTPKKIQSIVRNIPRSVSEAYDKILSKSRDIELARKLLHIVVAASRPLTLREMSLALAMKPHHQSITDVDSVPEGQFRDDLRQLCGLFLIVVNSRIYLLHQTAREFLIQASARSLSPLQSTTPLQWEFSFHPEESHRILAEICIQRLSFADLDDFSKVLYKEQRGYFAIRTLLEYAVRHWTDHFRKAKWKDEDQAQAVETAILYCHSDSPASAWYSIYQGITSVDTPGDFTPLLLASYFGLSSVLDRLSKKASKDINIKDKDYRRSAISWAAKNGHDAAVERLLNRSLAQRLLGRGARLNTKDKLGSTPLALACEHGHEVAVQHLLKAGADVDTKNTWRETPLWIACTRGHDTIVRNLLQAGADVNSTCKEGGPTPLWVAVSEGYDTIVQQLLQADADIDTWDEDGRTPLGMACEKGYDTIVQQLLQAGANIDIRNRWGETHIEIAVGEGYDTIVKQLLQAGASVDTGAGMGQTPLGVACERGNDTIAYQLLQAGAGVNTRDGKGQTPLGVACERGHDIIVQQLLQAGAGVNTRDRKGRTPLGVACERGHDTIVQHLLRAGADIDVGDQLGETPLGRACEGGYNTIVKQLLQAGADIDIRNQWGETPLGIACVGGYNTIVKQLLQAGADVNMKHWNKGMLKNISGWDWRLHRTPLEIAEGRGHTSIVQQLLQAGADVSTRDE